MRADERQGTANHVLARDVVSHVPRGGEASALHGGARVDCEHPHICDEQLTVDLQVLAMAQRMSAMPIMVLATLVLADCATAFAPSAAFAPSPAMAALSQRSARRFAAAPRPALALRMAVGEAADMDVEGPAAEAAAPVQTVEPSGAPAILAPPRREGTISTGPPARQQQQQQQHYYEQAAPPKGELVMEKGPVNMMIMASGGVATLAGGYFGVKFYKKRQQQLVDEFGAMMMYYVGDDDLTKDCIKEYKGKLLPLINGFHKKDMFKSYAKKLASDKPLGIQTLEHFRGMAKALGVSPAAALKECAMELVPYQDPTEPWERNANKPSVLGKLLWLTERCYPDTATIAALRGRFPKSYGDEIIDVLQNTLTEEAYKAILEKAGGPEAGLQPGFAELGYSQAEAEALIARLIEEARIAAEEAARLQAEQEEEARVQAIRELAVKKQGEKQNINDGRIKTHGEEPKKDEPAPTKASDEPSEYECQQCGFTLFVAKGREFKFFGDDFKCGSCGAGKEFFVDNATGQPVPLTSSEPNVVKPPKF